MAKKETVKTVKAKKTVKAEKTEVKAEQKPAKQMEKRISRKQRETEVNALVSDKKYSVAEAAELLPKVSLSKFAGSANLDVILTLKEKQANESIRGSIVFPNQFGELKTVVVLAEGEKVNEAKAAGADYVGLDEIVAKIDKGWVEFDVVIATPAVMPKIARLGKVLGPRQLMPNPKTGTVTDNVTAAVKSYKAGKIDFKMDAGKTVKVRFGKLDMEPAKLAENLQAAVDAVRNETRKLGPTALRKALVTPTMGPSIAIEI